ncbi:MAG: D-aminoacyl-tRNA deacylase [Opitutus sp.]
MRVVVQRVRSASVSVNATTVGAIDRGLLVLLGIQNDDTPSDVDWLAPKIVALRIFEDAAGKMNVSLKDLLSGTAPQVPFGLLVVSQFTLIASTRKGNRPSFNDAARPEIAIPLYESFVRTCEAILGQPVATGTFGAAMEVSLVNDGPVTLMLDSKLRE